MIFLCALFTRYPVILIPGSFRSKLSVTSSRRSNWFCPKSANDTFVFINPKYFVPPYLGCFLDWLTIDYNETTDVMKNRENVDIFSDDFGGLSSVRGTGPNLFGTRLQYLERMVKKFEKHGYTEKLNLFAAPYDWRFGAAVPDSYYHQLKNLVEKAYTLNNNTRVALISHSLGAQIAHIFLTEKTDKEWRQKYINSTTFIAPSWSGSGTSVASLWRIQLPIVTFFKPKTIIEFALTLGTLHIHIPHMLAYANTTLFIDTDGKEYKGNELIDLFVRKGKLSERYRRVGEKNYVFLRRYPVPPDVDTNILFNSGIQTSIGLDVSRWGGIGAPIKQKGDGLVGSAVIEWVIQNWKMNKIFRYHDMNSPLRRYKHKNLLSSKGSLKVLFDWILPDRSHHQKVKDL